MRFVMYGSTRSVTDSHGVQESYYDYDIFGSPITGNYTTGADYGYLGKPYDSTTGLYNYGYRDYSPHTVRFTTVDPIRDGANWFAYVNNDPVNYVDLWGLELQWKKGEGATDEDIENARQMGETIASSDTIAGERWNELVKSDKTIVIEVNKKRYNDATPGNNEKLNPIEAIKSVIGIGGDVFVRFDPTDTTSLSDGTPSDPESTLAHEVAGHAYPMSVGTNPISRKKREQEATAIENEYRMFKGIPQRKSYGDWPVPQFYPQQKEGDNSNEKKNK